MKSDQTKNLSLTWKVMKFVKVQVFFGYHLFLFIYLFFNTQYIWLKVYGTSKILKRNVKKFLCWVERIRQDEADQCWTESSLNRYVTPYNFQHFLAIVIFWGMF